MSSLALMLDKGWLGSMIESIKEFSWNFDERYIDTAVNKIDDPATLDDILQALSPVARSTRHKYYMKGKGVGIKVWSKFYTEGAVPLSKRSDEWIRANMDCIATLITELCRPCELVRATPRPMNPITDLAVIMRRFETDQETFLAAKRIARYIYRYDKGQKFRCCHLQHVCTELVIKGWDKWPKYVEENRQVLEDTACF
jgi:hypothetical protein